MGVASRAGRACGAGVLCKRFGAPEVRRAWGGPLGNDDPFNSLLMSQALRSLWLGGLDETEVTKQGQAALSGLMGIAPKDEIEGMLAAQMLACHNAATECYRRAMIPDQTFDGRNANLAQANRLSRSFSMRCSPSRLPIFAPSAPRRSSTLETAPRSRVLRISRPST